MAGLGYSTVIENATRAFVKTYGQDIIDSITDTNLFFSAVVAQKAYESGWGGSTLASKYHNFGGIKNPGTLPNAGTITLDTTEWIGGVQKKVKAKFATFSSPKISFQTYVQQLQSPLHKYVAMGVFDATTPEEQIRLIAKAGYTTTNAESYLKKMQSIINAARDIYKLGKISSHA